MAALNLPIAVLRYTWKDSGPMGSGSYRDVQFNELFTSPNWWWGIAKFWSDTTLGTWDCCTNSRVFPWRILPLDQKMGPDPNDRNKLVSLRSFDEIVTAALEAAEDDGDLDFHIENFSVIVVFIDPPPSSAHGSPARNVAVLDRNGPMSFMAHEVGHALLMPHSGDAAGKDYGDPYCMMSAMATYTFAETTVYPDPDVYHTYYEALGPMTAAATLYASVPGFAHSSSVVAIPPNARDTYFPITLRAFSKATLGDAVLAVLEVDGEQWTAEYRVQAGWDKGLPGNALVLHTIRRRALPGEMAITRYVGSVRTPFDRGIRDWQAAAPVDADLGVVVERADDETVTFQFRRKKNHAVTLDREMIILRRTRGPVSKSSFPVWNGLCGEQQFENYSLNKWQRLALTAKPVAYVDPAFKWRLNGIDVPLGKSLTFLATTYIDDGISVKAQPPREVTVACRNNDDANPPRPLPTNTLWLENDPNDGIYDVAVEVDVSDQGPRPPLASGAAVSDQFEGAKRIIEGKDEADQKCRDYWYQLGDKLPKDALQRRIDKGDPIWRFLHRPELHSKKEEEELVGLVVLARALHNIHSERAGELTEALARRLGVPEALIVR